MPNRSRDGDWKIWLILLEGIEKREAKERNVNLIEYKSTLKEKTQHVRKAFSIRFSISFKSFLILKGNICIRRYDNNQSQWRLVPYFRCLYDKYVSVIKAYTPRNIYHMFYYKADSILCIQKTRTCLETFTLHFIEIIGSIYLTYYIIEKLYRTTFPTLWKQSYLWF